MKSTALIFALLTCTARAESGLSIETVEGNVVQVSASEVVRSYSALIQKPTINTRIVNGDDSISIVNPQIMYAGVAYNPDGTVSDQTGLCKWFKLGKFQAMETQWAPTGRIVMLNEEGKLAGSRTKNLISVAVVTCAPN